MTASTPEHVDVLIVGAGISGIGAACHLRADCPQKTFAILEARDAIGGTWDLFRYPGVRSEPGAEGEHVRVRPHARVAEQVPGAADGVAGLQDGVGLARERGLEVMRSADPGQPRPDDQDVDVLAHRRAACRARSRFSSPATTSK